MTQKDLDEVFKELRASSLHSESVENFIKEIELRIKYVNMLPSMISTMNCRVFSGPDYSDYILIPFAYYSTSEPEETDEDLMLEDVLQVRNIAFKDDNSKYYIHVQKRI